MKRSKGKLKVSKRTGLRSVYVVYKAGGQRPSKYALTYRSAVQAAKELSKKTGNTYYVFQRKPKAKVEKRK